MASETDICNLALGRFGEKSIKSLTEDNTAGRVCRQFYEQTRDELLRSHRWNFAMKRAALVDTGTAPAFGYDHAYSLPSDFMRIASVNEDESTQETTYVIEGAELLSSADAINLRYVYQVTDTLLFDPLFTDALSTKLAAKIAPNLSGDWQLGRQFMEEYIRMSGSLARRIDAAADNSANSRESSAINSQLSRSRLGTSIG